MILLFPSQIASYFQTPPGTDPSQVTLANQIADNIVGFLNPNGWAYVLLDTHPPLLDRIEMAQAWKARNPGATPLFDR